jgi:hypothetical protein
LGRGKGILRLLEKLQRWRRVCQQIHAFLEHSLDLQKHWIWKVFARRSKFFLAMWKDVLRLGQKSSPLGMATLHWFESSWWGGLTHLYWCLCIGYNKWFGWVPHNHDGFKQVGFQCPLLDFIYIINIKSHNFAQSQIIIFLFLGPLRWTMWNLHWFTTFFAFNPSTWFSKINSRRLFLMSNTKNARIKLKDLVQLHPRGIFLIHV